MPARLQHQTPALSAQFAERMRETQERERVALRQRVDRSLPGWISGPLKACVLFIVVGMWRHKHTDNQLRGATGEGQLTLALRLRLPAAWCLIPNVLIQPDAEHLTQIDLLAVGPAGLFVIETKNWQGAHRASGDRWQRRQGSRWVPCESPTRQNAAHVRHLFRWWTAPVHADAPLPSPVMFPVVVMLHTRWLRVSHAPMPVLDSPRAVAHHLHNAAAVWSPSDVQRVLTALLTRPSYQYLAPRPSSEPPAR